MRRLSVAEILLKENLIDQAKLDSVLAEQRKTGEDINQVLIKMKVISEKLLFDTLSKEWNVPYIDLFVQSIDPSIITLLPEVFAKRYKALVIGRDAANKLLVGMVNPLDLNALDAIEKNLKQPIVPQLVSEKAVEVLLERFYRRTSEIQSFAKELSKEIGHETTVSEDKLFEESSDLDEEKAPVVKLLNSLFRDAVQTGASDIHIEPSEDTLRIRFRIDGVLNEYEIDDKRIAASLIQRLKLRANLDIAEHRLPLDGSFSFEYKGRAFDVRLSTLPTVYGEALVMRLLDQSTAVSDLSHLGIDEYIVKRIEAIYSKPSGMLLVTGPTGSGKSTTLYSVLNRLNSADRKIITVEDPVEYRINRVNQVQVQQKIDLTFARVLRAILRQDPDVIMIGEIRDTETATIAMRAAVTGHFVLATLHTNDAASSALRLIDMGVEGFMVAAAVKAIIAQRLIRNLCTSCKKQHEPDELEKTWLKSFNLDPATVKCLDAEGCSHCSFRGYVGRTGVYELLEFDDEMLTALRLSDTARFANGAKASKNYRPLALCVLDLVKSGITSINEAIRVIGSEG